MRLFQLDEVDDALTLLPMAARRALDAAGLRLSLSGWQSLPLNARQRLVRLGSATAVEVSEVRMACDLANPSPTPTTVRTEPGGETVPLEVTQTFGLARPIPAATWSALGGLERYVLMKVAERARPRRLDLAYQELIGDSALSSHLAPGGGVRMVDVGAKPATRRSAQARSAVTMNQEAFSRLLRNNPKGDVLQTARLAGIMAAKRTSELIPLCHALALSKVELDLHIEDAFSRVLIVATVETVDRTGVEMEALTAASVAALTVYDMLKAFDRAMSIGPTVLLAKSGGRTGDYQFTEADRNV